ncbi:MAG: family NAD(P)-dependent oxidoreductase [Herbinix sp.]|jgi:short-subunit dehydrogenase|nr:family NAD(P)-dependent oxidoreductase [Herbinix sp.]
MKAAIVTGASSGIGQEISKILLQNHYKVYGFGRNFSSTDIVSEYFIPISCDITDTKMLVSRIEDISDNDEVHMLINNAGTGYFGPHEELNPKKIHEMVAANLEAPLILTQLLLRDIKKYAGWIINISSVTAKKTNTHGCAYGATKAGLSSFSSSLFEEVRKYGVKVITIHPDMTKSNFYRNANFHEGDSDDTYLYPEEIAHTVDMIINNRDGLVMTDITMQPQKHQIKKQK